MCRAKRNTFFISQSSTAAHAHLSTQHDSRAMSPDGLSVLKLTDLLQHMFFSAEKAVIENLVCYLTECSFSSKIFLASYNNDHNKFRFQRINGSGSVILVCFPWSPGPSSSLWLRACGCDLMGSDVRSALLSYAAAPPF